MNNLLDELKSTLEKLRLGQITAEEAQAVHETAKDILAQTEANLEAACILYDQKAIG